MKRWLALAIVTIACAWRSPAPDDGCDAAAKNIQHLGWCGLDRASFVAGCHAAAKAESKFAALPTRCMAVAADCATVLACR